MYHNYFVPSTSDKSYFLCHYFTIDSINKNINDHIQLNKRIEINIELRHIEKKMVWNDKSTFIIILLNNHAPTVNRYIKGHIHAFILERIFSRIFKVLEMMRKMKIKVNRTGFTCRFWFRFNSSFTGKTHL